LIRRLRTVCTNVDPTLIADKNVTSKLNICKIVRKTELVSSLSHFCSFNIMAYFIYTDLIRSLLDPRLVDPGSTLIYVGAYDPRGELTVKSLKRY